MPVSHGTFHTGIHVRCSAPTVANPCIDGIDGCTHSAQPGRRRCAECIRASIKPLEKGPARGVAKGSRNHVLRALDHLHAATRPELVKWTGLHAETVKRVMAQLVTEERLTATGQSRPSIAPSGRKVYHKVFEIPATRSGS